METIEVPEILEMPDPAPYDEDPVAFSDFVLTRLFQHSTALLHAEWVHPKESVAWFLRSRTDDGATERDVPIAESPSCGSFRSVLARFGHHYMGGQLYNGFALRFLRQHDIVYRCLIYTSNMSQSGFWIRVYGSRVND
jgi:hypothetical protein